MPAEPATLALTYEQPLTPGEARLEIAGDSLKLSWIESRRDSRKTIIRASLLTIAYAAWAGSHVYRFVVRERTIGGSIGPIFCGLFVLTALLQLVRLTAKSGRRITLLADRAQITFVDPGGTGVVPTGQIRVFTAEPRAAKGYALVMIPYPVPAPHVPWYKFRWSAPPKPGPIDLLVHPDAELIRRAADALNELLLPNATQW